MSQQEDKNAEPTANSADLVLLDPVHLQFRHEGNRLQLRAGGEEWQEVSIARLFPLSDPDGWIAVMDKDGKELGALKQLHGLPTASIACLREELHRRYLVPQIVRILACRDRFDLTEWEVETNRGPVKFLLRHPQESIQNLLPQRWSLTDVEGNRYDIADIDLLDAESRVLFEARL